MTDAQVIDLLRSALVIGAKLSAPILIASLVVGVTVSLLQTITQIQEQTLAFIPKIIAIAAVLVILGPWMLGQILTYTQNLYESIPSLVGG